MEHVHDDYRHQLQSDELDYSHLDAESTSDLDAFHLSTQYHTVVRSPGIPPVNTVPHSGQITRHSTCQHSTTQWSDHQAFHLSTQYHTVVRSPGIPPVDTVPHSGQITRHSTCRHSTTQWSDHQAFQLSTQYHTVVRSPGIPAVDTIPHSGQITRHSSCRHSTTQWSDHQAFQLSTQYHTVVRSPGIPPVNTVPHSGQTESLSGERRGAELSTVPSVQAGASILTMGAVEITVTIIVVYNRWHHYQSATAVLKTRQPNIYCRDARFCRQQEQVCGQRQSSYTPNPTAVRRNWRRQLHSSCRLDSQCSGDRKE